MITLQQAISRLAAASEFGDEQVKKDCNELLELLYDLDAERRVLEYITKWHDAVEESPSIGEICLVYLDDLISDFKGYVVAEYCVTDSGKTYWRSARFPYDINPFAWKIFEEYDKPNAK